MIKPNSLDKTSRHVHLKFKRDKKDNIIPHETSFFGRTIISEVLEDEDGNFIVKETIKFPFEKDKVKTFNYAKDNFKLNKTTW
ncbi:hypothetical protein KAH55_11525 [bacterium]|nr:hypothetical protein [bacterium]